VRVPDTRSMNDETFRLHLTHRHIPVEDFADLTGFHPGSTFTACRAAHEAYHDRLHSLYEYEDHHHE
jgi:hypothetical protein